MAIPTFVQNASYSKIRKVSFRPPPPNQVQKRENLKQHREMQFPAEKSGERRCTFTAITNGPAEVKNYRIVNSGKIKELKEDKNLNSIFYGEIKTIQKYMGLKISFFSFYVEV